MVVCGQLHALPSIQGALRKSLNWFIVSEVNSESEQARRPNLWSEQQQQQQQQLSSNFACNQ